MRLIRYRVAGQEVRYGWIMGDKVGPIDGYPFGEYRRLEAETPLDLVQIVSPVVPGKIIGVGRNYVEHAREQNVEVPEIPIIFLKPPSSIIGPDQTIMIPPQSKRVEHEAELAVVVGKTGKHIRLEDAKNHILGFTIANDVTARDLQRKDGQWTRGKGFDTFCPVGPWIETELDETDLQINCRVNDELRQMTSTRNMIFNVPQLIAFISACMTLEPGDLILTGTPAGTGPLSPGNTISITIEGIGTLSNKVGGE